MTTHPQKKKYETEILPAVLPLGDFGKGYISAWGAKIIHL